MPVARIDTFNVVDLWRRGVRCDRKVISAMVAHYASASYYDYGRWQRAYGVCKIPAVARLAPSQWLWVRRKEAPCAL